MSADDLDAINRYIQNTPAKTTAATNDKAAWNTWYNNLGFFDKITDATTANASAKRDRFNIDNNDPPIPSVPLTKEEAAYWDGAGVDVTGLSPEEAQKKVWTTTPAKPMPTSMTVNRSQIKEGSTGDNVKEWQRIVGVKIDGKFGPGTTTATKVWQKAHGLKQDGIVGPNTWGIAYGDLPKLNPEKPSPSTVASAAAATGPAITGTVPAGTFAPEPTAPKTTPAPAATVVPTYTTGGNPEPPKTIQAGMFGFVDNLPVWAKWAMAVVGIGGFAYGLKHHNSTQRKA